jgi:hypothetical protein
MAITAISMIYLSRLVFIPWPACGGGGGDGGGEPLVWLPVRAANECVGEIRFELAMKT